MRKLLPLLAVVILVLSGLGVVALNIEKESITAQVDTENLGDPKDYTHTVLVEVGTRSTCPGCVASNIAWKDIYEGGNYDFEYTELVYNENPKADQRLEQFNPAWNPTSYFDGGQYLQIGTNYSKFYDYLDSSGSRTVPDLDADLSAMWLGNAKIDISLSVENNDNDDYPGTLRVYIIELESPRWNDKDGNPYWHAFLDFAWEQAIDIDSGDTFEDNKVWDGVAAGYPDISSDNIQVILAVFDDTPHQQYSDPPDGNPFNAYYADETVATLIVGNQAPNKPTINGPTSGKAGTSYTYTFTSTDPDGDNVSYYIKWGDGSVTDWTAFQASGPPGYSDSHVWDEQGTYTIEAKAKDTSDVESEWADFLIVIKKDEKPPNIRIIKPEKGLYFFDKKIRDYLLSFRIPLIIGMITIEVNASDEESGIDRVEFYLNGKYMGNDTSYPYTYDWRWTRPRLIHLVIIKVIAYDNNGNNAIKGMFVRKFL